MAKTTEIEARLQRHMATIGEDNWHDVDRDVISLLAAIGRVREALYNRFLFHENADHKTRADDEALKVVAEVRKALEGEA